MLVSSQYSEEAVVGTIGYKLRQLWAHWTASIELYY